MDDDLQHPPEEIPRLLEKLAEGHDVVYGTPRERPHSWCATRLRSSPRGPWPARWGWPTSGISAPSCALRTELRQASASFRGSQLLLDALLAWGTSRFASIPVQHMPRAAGRSNYNLYKLIHQTILLLTGFSTGPLRLASLVGFFFTVFGMAVLAYVLGVYFIEGSLAGFPFLASIISILSGAQLFTLGIFGEYLAHIFNRSLDRPTYAVRSRTAGRMAPRGEVTSPGRSVVRCRTDVSLAPLGPEHAGAMFRWMSDPQVSRNIGLRSEPSPERTSRWIANCAGRSDDPPVRRDGRGTPRRQCHPRSDRPGPRQREALGLYRRGFAARFRDRHQCDPSGPRRGLRRDGPPQGLADGPCPESYGAQHLRPARLRGGGGPGEEFVLDEERLPALYMGLLREEFEGSRVFSPAKGDQP